MTAGLEEARANGADDVDAAKVNPKKNGIKSIAFVIICFKRIAIPTHGNNGSKF